MFEQINLLFTAGTIEDDRDSLVLQTLCRLIEQNQSAWTGYTLTEVTHSCLGVSIDQIYVSLPISLHVDGCTRPALTIYQLIASLKRLEARYFIKTGDDFVVIHLHRTLLLDLNRAMDAEMKRIAERSDEIGQNIALLEAENILLTASLQA